MYKYIVFAVLAGSMASQTLAAAKPIIPGQTNNAPIEINADQLEVFQEENRAVFSGHVVAIQGDVRLKAEKMNVFYRQPDEKSGKGDQDAIKKIEVQGGVFLATPQETASGSSGVYDVENHAIILNDNVVLTRDKNTLKGDKLKYDFNTGKSTIVGGVKSAQGGKPERVRALFVPDKKPGVEKK